MKKDLFKNKYRIPSSRAPWWDYSKPATYFITICTRNKAQLFGYIENGEMHRNQLGEFAHHCFKDIPDHFPFAEIINFVIMPDHVHGLIRICFRPKAIMPVSDPEPELTNPVDKNEFMASISPKRGSLASIVRSYKSAVTKFANENHLPCGWHERFHDHIVRNSGELQRISDYISNNPGRWGRDKPNRESNELFRG